MSLEIEIKDLYKKLTGGKEVSNENYLISQRQFNSIAGDRFISELNSLGINWDGNEITLSNLIKIPQKNETLFLEKKSIPTTTYTESTSYEIGVDLQIISELPKTHDYWENQFYKTKFKPSEIAHCIIKDNPLESFAGIYAAKEAIIKCNNIINFNDIEIIYDAKGKPLFQNFKITISHSGNFAIAIAVIQFNLNYENNKVQNLNKLSISSNFLIVFSTIFILITMIYIIHLFK